MNYFCICFHVSLCTIGWFTLWSSACFRFVSDNAYNSYKAICQHKLIQAMQKSFYGPETARTYPLSLLEWTANRKKANMVLQVHCFDGESNIDLHWISRLLKGKHCLSNFTSFDQTVFAIPKHISSSYLFFLIENRYHCCGFQMKLKSEIREGLKQLLKK